MNPTIEAIKRKRKAAGLEGRRLRKPPRWRYPKSEERRWQAALVSFVRDLKQAADDVLIDALPNLVEQADRERPTSDAAAAGRLDAYAAETRRLIDKLKIQIKQQTDLFEPDLKAQQMTARVNRFNRGQWESITKAVFSVDVFTAEPWLAELMDAAVYENAALITSLGSQSTDQVEAVVVRGMRQGARHEEIARQIRERYAVAASRARLIGRDQVAKLNGQLAEARQQELGVRHYIWRTSQDERVRPSHARLEGTRQAWDDPPDVGHPGQDIQCRCTAEPDMAELLNE